MVWILRVATEHRGAGADHDVDLPASRRAPLGAPFRLGEHRVQHRRARKARLEPADRLRGERDLGDHHDRLPALCDHLFRHGFAIGTGPQTESQVLAGNDAGVFAFTFDVHIAAEVDAGELRLVVPINRFGKGKVNGFGPFDMQALNGIITISKAARGGLNVLYVIFLRH